MSANPIGDYLRARRDLVKPEDVGVPTSGGRRRVPGLRRSEVAFLAGVSPEYYQRLEQGRARHPSPQVLDALARALNLDEEATEYLLGLAGAPASRRRRSPRRERVPVPAAELLESWDATPAYIQGRYLDVLAVNQYAGALAPFYAPGENLLRAAFLDPRVRSLFLDWDSITEGMVAELRATLVADHDDPRLNELVGELSVHSERFRKLWARHEARRKPPGAIRFDHPEVGRLELNYLAFGIPGTDGQELVVWQPERGSRSAESLSLLCSLASSKA